MLFRIFTIFSVNGVSRIQSHSKILPSNLSLSFILTLYIKLKLVKLFMYRIEVKNFYSNNLSIIATISSANYYYLFHFGFILLFIAIFHILHLYCLREAIFRSDPTFGRMLFLLPLQKKKFVINLLSIVYTWKNFWGSKELFFLWIIVYHLQNPLEESSCHLKKLYWNL